MLPAHDAFFTCPYSPGRTHRLQDENDPERFMIGHAAPGGNGFATIGTFRVIAPAEPANRAYAATIANRAKDEGAPGLRGEPVHGAHFRDPDADKLCVFKVG